MDERDVAEWLLGREGLDVGRLRPLEGGYEQAVFCAGATVVRVCGPHRGREQLARAYASAEALAQREPELVVAPVRLSDGSLLAVREGMLASLWPRVAGDPCDRSRPEVRDHAARAVARLHRAAEGLRGPPARSDERVLAELTDELRDRDLEAWRAQSPACHLLIHGDIYPGNLLWVSAAGRLAIIDWDEARSDDPARELAWAAWEFCRTTDGADLDRRRADAFLASYAEQAGGLPAGLPDDLLRWIRWHLAFEMGRALRTRRNGEPGWDEEYFLGERAAFSNLAGRS
jgi:Ser/Thr protein kinase RdoA (MazF antagonist)